MGSGFFELVYKPLSLGFARPSERGRGGDNNMAVLQRVARNCNCHKLSTSGGFFDMQTNTRMHKPKIPAFSPQCQHKYGTMVACRPIENLEARVSNTPD